MTDYQEISDKIEEYYELKDELKGLSAEALQNSKEYRRSLAIDNYLKNQIFDGGELLKIANNIYTKYENLKKENGELENKLEETEKENEKLEDKLKETNEIIIKIKDIHNFLKKYQ
ncbi:hypothetical protein HYS72_00200, partial [Candidatus Pacearchaeota archaeon]|nr:hypothetical protein [Candidatus Pacearchaeota archaeon]